MVGLQFNFSHQANWNPIKKYCSPECNAASSQFIMMKLKSVTDSFTTLVISRVVFATKNVNSRVL